MKKILICLSIFTILFNVAPSVAHANDDGQKGPVEGEDYFEQALVAPLEPVYLPIIMYHQLTTNPARLDTYIISQDEFESDLQLLQNYGYTTVTVKDLLNFCHKREPLPERPVMITFDDGFESDYIYGFPILKKYNMKAIFSIIGRYTDMFSEPDAIKHINYAHLSWEEIEEMYGSGLAEFHNHTYDLHSMEKRRGALPYKYESDEEYRKVLKDDLGKLNEAYEQRLGYMPAAFACPFGAFNDRMKEGLRYIGFSVIFTSQQKINKLTGNPEELMRLNRFLRAHGKSVDKLLRQWEQYYKAATPTPVPPREGHLEGPLK
ncbi:MAG: polysaccharide deacetylase family protein [Clostridiales bacterium]|jgi:peptidoglycan/xylan/chitin deacetylase (PgdA/CDA1 family)|nr:polysaccharide deacetylase family protein [Clostridiales bacterium]